MELIAVVISSAICVHLTVDTIGSHFVPWDAEVEFVTVRSLRARAISVTGGANEILSAVCDTEAELIALEASWADTSLATLAGSIRLRASDNAETEFVTLLTRWARASLTTDTCAIGSSGCWLSNNTESEFVALLSSGA